MMNKISYLLIMLFFFGTSCKQDPKDQIVEATTKKEVDISQMDANQKWKYFVNELQDSLSTLYFDQAIKLNNENLLITGSDAIEDHYKKKDVKVSSIKTDTVFQAHPRRNYYYEIATVGLENGKTLKQLIIWNISEEEKLREFEFTGIVEEDASVPEIIDQRRDEWMELCNANNARNLVTSLYSEDAVYYNHKPPITNTEGLIAEYSYMNNPQYSLVLKPFIVEAINDELIFEIGQCEEGYNGKYIIIWGKQASGEWYVICDSNI